MNKRQSAGAAVLLLALLAIWAGIRLSRGTGQKAGEELTITALSIGKADALILQEGDYVVLIDAGEKEDGEEILQEFRRRGISRIDLFIVTHFDKDHVGGAAEVMEQMEVSSVRMPDYEGDRPEYGEFLQSLEGCPDVRRLTEPARETTGAMEITIYPAENPEEIKGSAGEYDNDMSLVASLRYGERTFLLTGDIEETRIGQMLASGVDWSHDWIKMPHHGRYQKALEELLAAVEPKWAVICCSEKHPAAEETLKLLQEMGIKTWDTGTRKVVTWSDGENIDVEYEN